MFTTSSTLACGANRFTQFLFLHWSCPRAPLCTWHSSVTQHQDRRCWLAYFMPAPFIKWVLSEAHAIRLHANAFFPVSHSCSSQTTHSSTMWIISLLRLTDPWLFKSFDLFFAFLSILISWLANHITMNHRTRNETILLVSGIIYYLNRNSYNLIEDKLLTNNLKAQWRK